MYKVEPNLKICAVPTLPGNFRTRTQKFKFESFTLWHSNYEFGAKNVAHNIAL